MNGSSDFDAVVCLFKSFAFIDRFESRIHKRPVFFTRAQRVMSYNLKKSAIGWVSMFYGEVVPTLVIGYIKQDFF